MNQKPARLMAAYDYAPEHHHLIYGPEERAELAELFEITSDGEAAEVLLAGWGCAPLDQRALDAMPRLRAVFYAGGSVKGLVADGALFRRGLRLSTSNAALAESVAEYCLAQILLANKRAWRDAAELRRLRSYPPRVAGPGNFGTTVGLLGYGAIARALRRLLRPFPLHVLVHDPYLRADEAKVEGVERAELAEVFARAEVVSCHLPKLPATLESLRAEHFRTMKPGATFLNTARGEVVREEDLATVLRERPDLWAILDVVAQEPIPSSHPFLDLTNVTITPHIAGSMGDECRRFGRFVLEEARRWLRDEPLLGEVRVEDLSRLA